MGKQRKPNAVFTFLAAAILALFIALMFAASPLIALLVGMFIGWVLEVFTGDYVVQAFNAIGMTHVKDGDLPKVFGLLSVVAAMIKIGVVNAKSKKTTND